MLNTTQKHMQPTNTCTYTDGYNNHHMQLHMSCDSHMTIRQLLQLAAVWYSIPFITITRSTHHSLINARPLFLHRFNIVRFSLIGYVVWCGRHSVVLCRHAVDQQTNAGRSLRSTALVVYHITVAPSIPLRYCNNNAVRSRRTEQSNHSHAALYPTQAAAVM